MAVREGKWKCPGCATVNLGREVHCTACGKARENVEFFLDDDDAPEVTDAATLERAGGGADWICAYCDQSNKALDEKCVSCGGPRTEGKERAAGDVVGLGYKSASEQRKAEAAAAASQPGAVAAPAGSGSKIARAFAGCLVAALLLCCLGSFFYFKKREAQLAVTSVAWKRAIEVQKLATVQEQDWSVPQGARVLGESREIKTYRDVQTGTRSVTKTRQVQTGTKRVKVGKRDKGNGFFEDVYEDKPVYGSESYTEQEPVFRKEPIYATKYRYEVEKWLRDHDEVAQGTDLTPAWPKTQLASDRWREGTRSEDYEVKLQDAEGKPAVYRTKNEQDFARFAIGSRWIGLVDRKGEASDLKPAGTAAGGR